MSRGRSRIAAIACAAAAWLAAGSAAAQPDAPSAPNAFTGPTTSAGLAHRIGGIAVETLRPGDGQEVGTLVLLPEAAGPDFDTQRRGMVAALQAEALVAAPETGVASFDERVLDAMASVPRHDFVPRPLRPLSYVNRPLPLGWGLRMPSPFLTALMAQVAQIEPHERVLQTELRAGYQAAILARLASRVDVGSSRAAMAVRARQVLLGLGIRNIGLTMRPLGQSMGPAADYDAILVEEPCAEAPAELLARLRPLGRLVYTRRLPDGAQVLTVVARQADGQLQSRAVLPLRRGRPGTST